VVTDQLLPITTQFRHQRAFGIVLRGAASYYRILCYHGDMLLGQIAGIVHGMVVDASERRGDHRVFRRPHRLLRNGNEKPSEDLFRRILLSFSGGQVLGHHRDRIGILLGPFQRIHELVLRFRRGDVPKAGGVHVVPTGRRILAHRRLVVPVRVHARQARVQSHPPLRVLDAGGRVPDDP